MSRLRFQVEHFSFWLILLAPSISLAVKPNVKTVPWVAVNPLIPHDAWSGGTVTLKGTTDVQGPTFEWAWDFGDGTPVATGTVSNKYVVEARHTYTGAVGLTLTARLTVRDSSTGESTSQTYFVAIREKILQTEVNVAIDEGLWYLHKTQRRTTEGITDFGDWIGSGFASGGDLGITTANINAFEGNGHLESGSPANPYTETVQRGMRRLFTWLTTSQTSVVTNPLGTFLPDGNGNGYLIRVNSSFPFYEGGMFMDAIIASGTPNAIAPTGPGPSGTNPGIIGRTYKDIVQDMVDGYLFCQYRGGAGGGWRYSCAQSPDNSACQWAAIGLIPAQRVFGVDVPRIAKDWNRTWLVNSQNTSTGELGYENASPAWGPYATTPSGMVQMAMDGIGRGNPMWDKAETFMRNNFGSSGGATSAVKSYYYGMFSFVKALLLHDPVGNGVAQPIALLTSTAPGVPPIDWYAAETSRGDPTDGVARTLVKDQNPAGFWSGKNFDSRQYPFETAWAITMLNRTIFTAGAPVAVAKVTPNPALANQTITLDGSSSFHQDPSKTIVSWQWDLDNNGIIDKTGPVVTTSFAALGNYPVKLVVADNGTPPTTAQSFVTVLVSIPPIAPTSNAGGPYTFCPQSKPWFLDGTKSVNPDDGKSEPGKPPDAIKSYLWDLSGSGSFADASGQQPNVTQFFTNAGPGGYVVQLRVTDSTSTSFPTSGQSDLTSTSSAQVVVKNSCSCITSLVATATSDGKVQLAWPSTGSYQYNVYRGTTNGGPYSFVAIMPSGVTNYLDTGVISGNLYYYVVREANQAGSETCQSNQVSATPISDRTPPVTTAKVMPTPNANGWNNTNATVAFSAADEPSGSGVKQITIVLAGGTTVIPGNAASVPVTQTGNTTITYYATDNAGNQESIKTLTVLIDTTPPVISGLPGPGCNLWPPNHKMVPVATVAVSDVLSGAASFDVTVTFNEPPNTHEPDFIIAGTGLGPRAVQLRSERLGTSQGGRIYAIAATASDAAGNTISKISTCSVSHDQGK